MMDDLYHIAQFVHVIGFAFMSIPLFNLIVVNERAQLGTPFDYYADRYMENIIRRGATRCFVFQATVFLSGIMALVWGPLGLDALWQNPVVAIKTVILLTLTGLLSYVHLVLQPKIEAHLAEIGPDTTDTDSVVAAMKPYRVVRKKLATFCLFLVLAGIILGLQVYSPFGGPLTAALFLAAGLFTFRVNRSLIKFGWV